MKSCGQLCPWNTLYGCQKPESEPCILSNMPCKRFEQKPQTNADRIRSMTNEELADILCVSCAFCACHPLDNCPSSCQAGVLAWLKQPYKEDT